MTETVLVTGAAGFIGAAVAEALLEQGRRVVGIDNLCDYYDLRLKEYRLAQLSRSDRFQFHRLDIENQESLEHLFVREGFETVFHFAARAGVRCSIDHPHIYQTTNVIGTLNVLQAMANHGVQKGVLASSSSLYAGHEGAFVETLPVDRPLSPYAASKKSMEVLAYAYHHLYQLDLSILRFFTVYGPAGRPDMSPFRFTKWIAEGTPLTVYGDGKQSRDFTFISDVVQASVAAEKPLGYEIINVGGGNQPVTLLQMISVIERLLGRQAERRYLPESQGDMRHTASVVAKAFHLLSWQPQVGLESGLEALVAWYRDNETWLRELTI